ncbi:MAG: cell division protein FtsQ/DivIB [Candidatus Marisimplicoccus sp.]
MNRFLTTIFMLSLISFMILLSSFIEYNNHESNTEYNVYYALDNRYNNKPIIDSIMTNKSNIELIKANKLNEIESKLYEIESIHEANIFRDINFNLSINIEERAPLAYYEKKDSYIDLSGKIIKRNKELDDRLPILSGETSKNNIKKVVDVIKAFNEDDFLNKELERIWFNEDELFLKLNSFQFDIRFGDNSKMNKKLEMLKGFCIYNMENKGNENYKQIDLVYDNQLIAIKK